ncbi:hypothetical protein C8Q76DRAFT_463668 [Earliella scabrosa]|nr:hypothetical protein C8Q76DRAFT_463668 [Earliella scabrosa]
MKTSQILADVVRDEPSSYLALGYPTAVAMMRALQEWIHLHSYSIMLMVNCHVYCHEGVSATLASSNAVGIILHARPVGNDPAEAFYFDGMITVAGPDLPDPESFRALCEKGEASIRGADSEPVPPPFAGVIPTVYRILEAEGMITVVKPCTLQYPPDHVADTMGQEMRTKVFEDISVMCAAAVVNGMILDHVEQEPQQGRMPNVEQFVRVKKRWRKRTVPEALAWGTVWAVMLNAGLSKTGLCPQALWSTFGWRDPVSEPEVTGG